MITVLAGGVGAARMLRGITLAVGGTEIEAIVNTGDDSVMHGLHISPDLDTVTYTLAEAIDPGRGWGLVDESWTTMAALARYTPFRPDGSSAGGTWFNLGDKDLATHLYRTGRLREGATLAEATAEITRAWGLEQRIMPMTNHPVRTRVRVNGSWMEFQEYFVGQRHAVAVEALDFAGVDNALPLPEAMTSIAHGTAVVIAPSNPLVSIGPILALRGVRERLAARRKTVVGVSPIVAGAALKGPADRMLIELGHEPTVVGVARMYADFCGTLVIDHRDAHLADAVRDAGMNCVVTETIMSTPEIAAALAHTCLEACT